MADAGDGWDEIISRFRSLGGVFDNAEVRSTGEYRGVFSIDPTRDVRITVPPALLVDSDDVTVENGELRLSPAAAVSSDVRAFFEAYNRVTSWAGARSDIANFLTEAQRLPEACKAILIKEFNFNSWFEPVTDELVLSHFTGARRIRFRDRRVLMPILELTNHDWRGPTVSFSDDGITLSARFKGELMWSYRAADAIIMLRNYRFASPERLAFSLPFEVFDKRLGRQIRVGWQVDKFKVINSLREPIVTEGDKLIEVTFLVLGDRVNALRPRKSFQESLGKHLGKGALEFFEGLLFYNRQKFFEVLATLEDSNEPAARLVRKACRYQLEALNMVSFQ
jgi:hypothetical protein